MTDGQTRQAENFVSNRNVQIVLACTVLAVAIFIIDISSLPLGVAAGVAYVAVVLVSLWLPGWKFPFVAAAGVSVLTVLGFLLSEPAGVPWMVVANRLLALAAIWLTAIVGSWLIFATRKHSEEAFQKAEQEADRARNAKSRFLETASNDMRQHLQTLSLLNGALRKTVSDPKAHKLFAMQSDAVAHLSDLLHSLLELSNLESGDVELIIGEISIADIFGQLQDEFDGQARAKGLQLSFDSEGEVAYADRKLLTRIIRILVSNAIRYTKEGGVQVYCRPESDGLRITVEDSGIGIEPDQLARIFEEFHQVDGEPIARNGGLGLGLGLGLLIVERSLNLLGANLEMESKPGLGSRFSIGVPAYS